jgi:hypothetical protein
MYTTVNQEGQLNNYAPIARIRYAEYPTMWEQRRYIQLGAIATLFVSTLVLIAFVAS